MAPIQWMRSSYRQAMEEVQQMNADHACTTAAMMA